MEWSDEVFDEAWDDYLREISKSVNCRAVQIARQHQGRKTAKTDPKQATSTRCSQVFVQLSTNHPSYSKPNSSLKDDFASEWELVPSFPLENDEELSVGQEHSGSASDFDAIDDDDALSGYVPPQTVLFDYIAAKEADVSQERRLKSRQHLPNTKSVPEVLDISAVLTAVSACLRRHDICIDSVIEASQYDVQIRASFACQALSDGKICKFVLEVSTTPYATVDCDTIIQSVTDVKQCDVRYIQFCTQRDTAALKRQLSTNCPSIASVQACFDRYITAFVKSCEVLVDSIMEPKLMIRDSSVHAREVATANFNCYGWTPATVLTIGEDEVSNVLIGSGCNWSRQLAMTWSSEVDTHSIASAFALRVASARGKENSHWCSWKPDDPKWRQQWSRVISHSHLPQSQLVSLMLSTMKDHFTWNPELARVLVSTYPARLHYVGCRDTSLSLIDDQLWRVCDGGLNVYGRLLMQIRDDCLARGYVPFTPVPILLSPSPSSYAAKYIRVAPPVSLVNHPQLQVFDGQSYRKCPELLQNSKCVMPLSASRFLLLNHTAIAGVHQSVFVYFDVKRDLMQVSRLANTPSQFIPAISNIISVPVTSTMFLLVGGQHVNSRYFHPNFGMYLVRAHPNTPLAGDDSKFAVQVKKLDSTPFPFEVTRHLPHVTAGVAFGRKVYLLSTLPNESDNGNVVVVELDEDGNVVNISLPKLTGCVPPSGIDGATFTRFGDALIVLHGGYVAACRTSQTFVLDVEANVWSAVLMNGTAPPIAHHSAIAQDDCLLVVGGEATNGSAIQPYSLHIERFEDSDAKVNLMGNKQVYIGFCVPCGLQGNQRVMVSRGTVVGLRHRAVLIGGQTDPFVPHHIVMPYSGPWQRFPTKIQASQLQIIEFSPSHVRVPHWRLLDDISAASGEKCVTDMDVAIQVESCGLFQVVCRIPSVLSAPHCQRIADIVDMHNAEARFNSITHDSVLAGKTRLGDYGILQSTDAAMLVYRSCATNETALASDTTALIATMHYIMYGSAKFSLAAAPAMLECSAQMVGIDSELYTSTASVAEAAVLQAEMSEGDTHDVKVSVRGYTSGHFPGRYSRENIAYLRSGRAVNVWLTFTTHDGVANTVPCHKEFLIARSPYLSGLYTTTFGDSSSVSVDLSRLTGRRFSDSAVWALLEYLYGDSTKVKLAMDDLISLAILSHYLTIPRFEAACVRQLCTICDCGSVDSLAEMWTFAGALSRPVCDDLRRYCLDSALLCVPRRLLHSSLHVLPPAFALAVRRLTLSQSSL